MSTDVMFWSRAAVFMPSDFMVLLRTPHKSPDKLQWKLLGGAKSFGKLSNMGGGGKPVLFLCHIAEDSLRGEDFFPFFWTADNGFLLGDSIMPNPAQ